MSYRLPLRRHWSVVSALQFSREQEEASTTDYAYFLTRATYQLHLSYLNLPVLLRFTLGPVYLEAGPQASLLLSGRGQGTFTYVTPSATIVYDPQIDQAATERYQRVDAGACVGVGVELPAGLGLHVRAYQGLVAMNRAADNQAGTIPGTSSQAYRQTLQASLTYQLAFAKK